MVQANFDRSVLLTRGTISQQYDYDNSAGGSDVSIASGTVMGIVSATGKIKPYDSTATDGTHIPRFVCIGDQVIPAGTTGKVTVAYDGWVNPNLLVFSHSGDSLATTVVTTDSSSQTTTVGTVRTELQANSRIILIDQTDSSYFD
jgi:hypothetical protein